MEVSIASGKVRKIAIEKKEVKNNSPLWILFILLVLMVGFFLSGFYIGAYFSLVILIAQMKKGKCYEQIIMIDVNKKVYSCSFNPTSLQEGDTVKIAFNKFDRFEEKIDAYALKIPSKGHLWTQLDKISAYGAAKKFRLKTVPLFFLTIVFPVLFMIISAEKLFYSDYSSLNDFLDFEALIVSALVAVGMCIVTLLIVVIASDKKAQKTATEVFKLLGINNPDMVSIRAHNKSFIKKWENRYKRPFSVIDDGLVFYC